MYTNPCFVYTFSAEILVHVEKLYQLGSAHPGARVYVRKNGKRQMSQLIHQIDVPYEATYRPEIWLKWWEKFSVGVVEKLLAVVDEVIVEAPLHCAEDVEAYLDKLGLFDLSGDGSSYAYVLNIEAVGNHELLENRQEPDDLESLFVNPAEITPGILESLRPFQPSSILHAATNPFMWVVWACGAGKTRAAILAGLTRQGPMLVVCPNRAVEAWKREIKKTTLLKPFVLKAVSKRRKKDGNLRDYLVDCKKNSVRPIVIVNTEAVSDLLDLAKQVKPTVLILDEIHEMANYKRWEATTDDTGKSTVRKRKTAGTVEYELLQLEAARTVEEFKDKDVDWAKDAEQRRGENTKTVREKDRLARSVALMELSRLPSLNSTGKPLRIGLSATPMGDGRHLRLWAPWDLLDPDGIGTVGQYKLKYCMNDKEPYNSFTGRPNDNGSSNKEELKRRSRFMMHEVTYSESHKSLPPIDLQFVYLNPEDQNKPDAFRKLIKEAEVDVKKTGNEEKKRNLVFLRLAESSTMKRQYVFTEAFEVLKQNGHVCIFTAMREDTEKWVAEFYALLKKEGKEFEYARRTKIWWGHGGIAARGFDDDMEVVGHDPTARQQIAEDEYAKYDGPALFIGTGDAFGSSINGLEFTDRAFFAMLPFGGDDIIQWRGRFDRGGQPTRIDIVVCKGTYEIRVALKLQEKLKVATYFTKSEEGRELLAAMLARDSNKVMQEIEDMLDDEYFDC